MIIGHGRRLRQAHDDLHTACWIRRGLCKRCGKTFTILPDWLLPTAHYTMRCRQQACERSNAGESLEQSTPLVKDPARLPDPSTLRRWSAQLANLRNVLGYVLWRYFPALPTNLAWDWTAIGRILHSEARAP